MKERPILFIGPMVRAILDGRKTQTRRILKCPSLCHVCKEGTESDPDCWDSGFLDADTGEPLSIAQIPCPYGQPGDRLWVRETHKFNGTIAGPRCTYRADASEKWFENAPDDSPAWIADDNNWCPSIFMPRWASRITLEIIRVRVERLQEITGDDAVAEGIRWNDCPTTEAPESIVKGWGVRKVDYAGGYRNLWEIINGTDAWAQNPWVWVIEFKKL